MENGILNEKVTYQISHLMSDTALVILETGETFLYDIVKRKKCSRVGRFVVSYDDEKKLYVLVDCILNPKIIQIYDAEHKKMLVNDWNLIYQSGLDMSFVVEEPLSRKKYIFDSVHYDSKTGWEKNFYDDIKVFDFQKNIFLQLIKRTTPKEECLLYQMNKGFVAETNFDQIEFKNNVFIGHIYSTLGDNKALFSISDTSFPIQWFSNISFDSKNPQFIYGTKAWNETSKDVVSVYKNEKEQGLVFYFFLECEAISYLNSYSSFDYFSFFQKGKNYLVSVERKKSDENFNVSVLKNGYDEIIPFHSYFLLKENASGKVKYGLYHPSFEQELRPQFQRIDYLKNDIFAFYRTENSDAVIARFSIPLTVLVSKCKIIKVMNDAIYFEKNGKIGMLDVKTQKVTPFCDEITPLSNGYFELSNKKKDNLKKGIWNQELIIPLKEYDSISFQPQKNNPLLDYQDAYFVLRRKDKKEEYVCYRKYKNGSNEIYHFSFPEQAHVVLLPDIIVVYETNETKVYAYSEICRPLQVFKGRQYVDFIETSKDQSIYSVDDVLYFYHQGRWERKPVLYFNLYAKAFESTYGFVVVNSHDKVSYERICNQLEQDSNRKMDEVLFEMYQENPQIQKDYPLLLRKKKK